MGVTIKIKKIKIYSKFFQKIRVINLTQGGLKAMEELAKLEEERRAAAGIRGTADIKNRLQKNKNIPAMPKGVASNEMCTFLILNISSLQLIPVNVIAYRSQYGSGDCFLQSDGQEAESVRPSACCTCIEKTNGILTCNLVK